MSKHRTPSFSAALNVKRAFFSNRCFRPLIPVLCPEVRKGPDTRDADRDVGCGGRVLRQCDIQAASVGDRCQWRMLIGTRAGELASDFLSSCMMVITMCKHMSQMDLAQLYYELQHMFDTTASAISSSRGDFVFQTLHS